MYTPEHFAITDVTALHRILREHPLGTLVTHLDGALDADHIPFEFESPAAEPAAVPAGSAGGAALPSCGVLSAHVARANPLWRRADGQRVMVVFRGAEAFVSPNWYPSKHEHHRQVPTWNYEVVHAHGVLRVHDDERFVRALVARLTRVHEAGEPRPWRMGDSAPEFIDGMLRNIVGITIHLDALTGKSKLSQNKEARDRLGAARVLAQRGHDELAGRMHATLPEDAGLEQRPQEPPAPRTP